MVRSLIKTISIMISTIKIASMMWSSMVKITSPSVWIVITIRTILMKNLKRKRLIVHSNPRKRKLFLDRLSIIIIKIMMISMYLHLKSSHQKWSSHKWNRLRHSLLIKISPLKISSLYLVIRRLVEGLLQEGDKDELNICYQ